MAMTQLSMLAPVAPFKGVVSAPPGRFRPLAGGRYSDGKGTFLTLANACVACLRPTDDGALVAHSDCEACIGHGFVKDRVQRDVIAKLSARVAYSPADLELLGGLERLRALGLEW